MQFFVIIREQTHLQILRFSSRDLINHVFVKISNELQKFDSQNNSENGIPENNQIYNSLKICNRLTVC